MVGLKQDSICSPGSVNSTVKSHYAIIPSRNVKFEKFMAEIFKSKMTAVDVRDHIVKYVQALETNYNDLIRNLKDLLEKEKQNSRKAAAEEVNARLERNDLESLFVECIEEVRKEIMRRRLKNEIYTRKKFHNVD